MPFNLLLLPLLGGFIFARFWNVTRFHVQRAEKERLLFFAALAGLGWLIVAFILVKFFGWLIPCQPERFCFPVWWRNGVPFEYSDISLLAFGLGAVAWKPLNSQELKKYWPFKKYRWFDRERIIDWVIDEDKAPFEVLLKKAQADAKTVAVTLKTGKVYVGFVIHSFNPALPTKYIHLMPTKSGYRDEDNKWYVFTTPYLEALDKIDRDYEAKLEQLDDASEQLDQATKEYEKNKHLETKKRIEELTGVIFTLHQELDQLSNVADDIGVVLAVSEIVSVSIYREFVHRNYFPPSPPTPDGATA